MSANAAPKKIFIIAGEASGDLHGANLIEQLKKDSSFPLEIFGVGGDKIRHTGAKEFFDLAHFHVTGITGAIAAYPKYKNAEKIILNSITKVKPDLVVLIDNPGFNLHLAKKIHALSIPIVYFIAPQVWAWAPKRVLKIKQYIKKVLVVFEFEKKFFEEHNVPVAWVGHPLKDIVEIAKEKLQTVPIEKKLKRAVALLPGSRKSEVEGLLPIFVGVAKRVRGVLPSVAFSIVKAPTIPYETYQKAIKGLDFPIQIVDKYAYDRIHESDLAIACSGTVTLECAILETPMLIVYKTSFLTYLIAKALITVKFLGLPNLILGEKKFPEFIQYEASVFNLSAAVIDVLSENDTYQEMMEACHETSRRLGPTGATQRAAQEILALL